MMGACLHSSNVSLRHLGSFRSDIESHISEVTEAVWLKATAVKSA